MTCWVDQGWAALAVAVVEGQVAVVGALEQVAGVLATPLARSALLTSSVWLGETSWSWVPCSSTKGGVAESDVRVIGLGRRDSLGGAVPGSIFPVPRPEDPLSEGIALPFVVGLSGLAVVVVGSGAWTGRRGRTRRTTACTSLLWPRLSPVLNSLSPLVVPVIAAR